MQAKLRRIRKSRFMERRARIIVRTGSWKGKLEFVIAGSWKGKLDSEGFVRAGSWKGNLSSEGFARAVHGKSNKTQKDL